MMMADRGSRTHTPGPMHPDLCTRTSVRPPCSRLFTHVVLLDELAVDMRRDSFSVAPSTVCFVVERTPSSLYEHHKKIATTSKQARYVRKQHDLAGWQERIPVHGDSGRCHQDTEILLDPDIASTKQPTIVNNLQGQILYI